MLRSDKEGFWQSVTGSLLENETPLEAARRELVEETGLSYSQGKLVDCHFSEYFEIYEHWRHRYKPGTTQNLEHVFCFILDSEKPVQISREHVKYCWLSKEEAIKMVTSPSNKSAIETFIV